MTASDRPQYAPGDKVRITIDATVIEEVPLYGEDGGSILDLAYEGLDGETNTCTLPPAGAAVTIVRTDKDSEPIAVLGFPLRISNILRRNRIHTVGDLLAKRPEDLKDFTSFGDACLAEVMATLGKRGLELQPTDIPLRAETVRVMAEIGDKS